VLSMINLILNSFRCEGTKRVVYIVTGEMGIEGTRRLEAVRVQERENSSIGTIPVVVGWKTCSAGRIRHSPTAGRGLRAIIAAMRVREGLEEGS
jgi:hypothetical protein